VGNGDGRECISRNSRSVILKNRGDSTPSNRQFDTGRAGFHLNINRQSINDSDNLPSMKGAFPAAGSTRSNFS